LCDDIKRLQDSTFVYVYAVVFGNMFLTTAVSAVEM